MGELLPSEKETLGILIDTYTNLQRIKQSTDREKEIDYQLQITKAKLESFGIVTSKLDM